MHVEPRHLLPGGVVRHDLAVDVALADAPGDEHAVLRAEVEDDDRLRARARLGASLSTGCSPLFSRAISR